MHSSSTFGARMSHGHTWIHKIHHGMNFGEASTFPFIVFSMTPMKATSKWRFSRDSQIKILAILDAHNFLCKLLIEVRLKHNCSFC
jgi:hypothetical protein